MGLTQITTGGVDDNINIDSNTLKVDGTNNRVGIGTAAPSNVLHVHQTDATANSYVHITQADGGSGATDGLSIGIEDGGVNAVIRNRENGYLRMYTNNSERLRIDSSGNLLVGKTASSGLNAGCEFRPAGMGLFTRASANPLQVRRLTDDGDLVEFYKDSTLRGSVGVSGSSLTVGVAGSERLRIDSSGRLMLGTTTPATNAEVTIRAASPQLSLYATPGNASRITLGDTDDHNIGEISYDNSDNSLNFATNAATRLNIDSSGFITQKFTSNNSSTPEGLLINNENNATGNNASLIFSNDSGNRKKIAIAAVDVGNYGASDLVFALDGADSGSVSLSSDEKMRIDSSGRLLIGTSSVRTNFYNGGGTPTRFQLEGTSFTTSSMAVVRNSNNASDAEIIIGKSRSGSVGGYGVVQSGDHLGAISFQGADGSELVEAASILATVDSTPGANDMPGRLVFSTTADGASSPTERMRINSTGDITVAKTTTSINTDGIMLGSGGLLTATRSNSYTSIFNRGGDDGLVLVIAQGNTHEGGLQVSGSSVSVQGAHLTRWSQLAGNAERIEILRGSVLSNLDEMCEWTHAAQDAVLYTEEDDLPEGVSVGDVKTPAVEAYTEDNEQLNRMKVSDVEGDVNVAGVFQDWDNDDETFTNDLNCAMTGDFIIRIAQGTTVARGDLLMSAGDGTAKPQDDDIVRSKTIAKVTSTTVSTTYADGSYCVPCVLMAC